LQQWHVSEQIQLTPMGCAPTDVAANLVNPGVEARRRVKTVQVAPCFEQGFLNDIVDDMRLDASCSRQASETQTCRGKNAILISQQSRAQPLSLAR
jgi:hypothetical protein